jgi:hypothetical protein
MALYGPLWLDMSLSRRRQVRLLLDEQAAGNGCLLEECQRLQVRRVQRAPLFIAQRIVPPMKFAK